MSEALIGVVAVFFAGLGVYGLIAPRTLVAPFGITLAGPEAASEVRAVYGGFGIAIASLLVVAMLVPRVREGAGLAVALALSGMAVGRLVSRCVDRPARFHPIWFYFWVETILAGVLMLALRL